MANSKLMSANAAEATSAEPFRRPSQPPSHNPEGAAFERLISAAVLVATAFRLRDEAGVTAALRHLVRAIRPFEAGPGSDCQIGRA